MKIRHLFFAPANFLSTVVLLTLMIAPFYFARNFAKVDNIAGVKTEVPYLITSQADKFPNLTITQNNNKYKIFFQKIGSAQAFLGVLTLKNPKSQPQAYSLKVTSGTAKLFFGQNLEEQKDQITLNFGASGEISIFSSPEASASSQTVEFKVDVK